MTEKGKDITIHTGKGIVFLFMIGLIGAVIMFAIILNVIFYKDYQRNKAFWNEIQEKNLGYCDEFSYFVNDCSLKYYLSDETEVCNIALKYFRKELINKLEICNFKIK